MCTAVALLTKMTEHHILVVIVLGLFSVILAEQRCEVVGVPAGVSQVLTVTGNSSVSTSATLSACERSEDGTWLSLPFHFPCVVGYNGIAEPGQKVEGDGKTPSGSFPLGELFGWNATAADPVVQSFNSDYRYIVDAKDVNGYYLDKFVDDSASPYYNTWVSGPTDASSFEEMRISAYKYGLVVNYNMYPTVPGNVQLICSKQCMSNNALLQ
jgi:L,D-peptidoglycan transpeptidase YkuD (ErfK/YbiS/YcfS/YnhG family)